MKIKFKKKNTFFLTMHDLHYILV